LEIHAKHLNDGGAIDLGHCIIIGGENGGGNGKHIHGIGPIVHQPSPDGLFIIFDNGGGSLIFHFVNIFNFI
jgi:hypothetical protein